MSPTTTADPALVEQLQRELARLQERVEELETGAGGRTLIMNDLMSSTTRAVEVATAGEIVDRLDSLLPEQSPIAV